MMTNKDNACWNGIMLVFKLVGEGETFAGAAHDGKISISSMKKVFESDWSYYRIRRVMREMKKQGVLKSSSHRYYLVKKGE